MNSEFVENFKKWKLTGERSCLSSKEKRRSDLALIDYLQTALCNNELQGTEEQGFAYWNISDSFALLKESNSLYKNHSKFADFLKDKPSKYLLWLVCDATQRFSLELGGWGEFWWNYYEIAVNQNKDVRGIEPITFECHNAALSVVSACRTPVSYLEVAQNHFRIFLKATEASDCFLFYQTVYSALCLKAFGSMEYDGLELGRQLFPWLQSDPIQNGFLIGEWKRLNGRHSKYRMATVGINRVINALIDTGKTKAARELYYEAMTYGLSANSYIEKRICI